MKVLKYCFLKPVIGLLVNLVTVGIFTGNGRK